MTEENKEKQFLKVLEAYTRDVGRGVARIDYSTMDSLCASTGDVVEIKGKRRTVAKCLPLYPSDEGKGIIRVDGLVRNNAGVAMEDTVTIKKTKAVPAEKVIVAPLEAIPPIDERYLADALESVSLYLRKSYRDIPLLITVINTLVYLFDFVFDPFFNLC
jgi:transitional endoplasmic reticulum ATPase